MACRRGSPAYACPAKEDFRASPPDRRRRGFLRPAAEAGGFALAGAEGGSATHLPPGIPEWTPKLGAQLGAPVLASIHVMPASRTGVASCSATADRTPEMLPA